MKIQITCKPDETRRGLLVVNTIIQLLGKGRLHKSQNEKVLVFWLTF